MVKWIVIGALVLGVIILIASFVPVLRRLSGLKAAMTRARKRQAEAAALQQRVAVMEETLAQVRHRAERMQRLPAIQAVRGRWASSPLARRWRPVVRDFLASWRTNPHRQGSGAETTRTMDPHT